MSFFGAAWTRNTQPSAVASASCGSRDKVHSARTKVMDDGQTNIDLGYSAPGLKLQGINVISQRKLQQQLWRRQTQACSGLLLPMVSVRDFVFRPCNASGGSEI